MRRDFFAIALIGIVFLTPEASARRRAARWIRCTATAYSVRGETANGDVTKYRQTAAADPAFIPLGSRVRIGGAGRYSGIYTVADTGRRVAGRTIDIFIPDPAAAKAFGKKPVRVLILRAGDEKPGATPGRAPRETAARP